MPYDGITRCRPADEVRRSGGTKRNKTKCKAARAARKRGRR